uniref:Uncharacterized protein n=1 Tax=Anguilla anguilla TaxID=7936 RepID=A0A0E9VW28_ANGAN
MGFSHFFNIIDVSAYNAFVIWTEIFLSGMCQSYTRGASSSRSWGRHSWYRI